MQKLNLSKEIKSSFNNIFNNQNTYFIYYKLNIEEFYKLHRLDNNNNFDGYIEEDTTIFLNILETILQNVLKD